MYLVDELEEGCQMYKYYERPKWELVDLDVEDVICASDGVTNDGIIEDVTPDTPETPFIPPLI